MNVTPTRSFPDFENPPVIEVVLGVQFAPIMALGTTQLGLIWERFRERFPTTQDHAALEPVFEEFDVRPRRFPFRVEISDRPPTPRCWFLNNTGTELVQLQKDRLLHNWRKVHQASDYPRYHKLKQTFAEDTRIFLAFLEENRFGILEPNQWEVTYVNHIPTGAYLATAGHLEKVVTVWQANYSDSFLQQPEDVQFAARYVIRDASENPFGRLHIAARPVYKMEDEKPSVELTLTARGKPGNSTVESALQSLDIGHEWVVRGFASITTPDAHSAWRRKDGN